MLTHPVQFTDHPFCGGLEPHQLQTLHALAHTVRYRPEDYILRAGEDADRLYLLQSGEVALQIHTPDRGPVNIGKVRAGDVLGWSWMVPPFKWHLDAQALSPVEALAIDGRRLRERCEQDPQLGYEIMRRIALVLLDRLQATRLQVIDFYSQNC